VILHRDGAARRDDPAATPSSVPEIGRSLRRERTRQGLGIEDVSVRTGVDPRQLQGLEGGTVDRLPDRVQTLKILRLYADFLGLPGERYVLVLVDHWPTGSLATPVVRVHPRRPPRPDDTGAIPVVVPSLSAGAPTGIPDEDHRTGEIPVSTGTASTGALIPPMPGPAATSSGPLGGFGPEPATAQVPRIDTTGPLPAVPGWSGSAKPRASPVLKVVVGVLALALAVGIAGIVINETHPQWLRNLGVTHGPAGSKLAPTGTNPVNPAPTFSQVASPAGTASFVVRASSFVVSVLAVGSASWMQIGEPGSAPLFSGIVQAGNKETFTVHRALVVEVGASSARAFVAVGQKLVGGYVPSTAPFTMTFRTS